MKLKIAVIIVIILILVGVGSVYWSTQTSSRSIEKINFIPYLAQKYETPSSANAGDPCVAGSTQRVFDTTENADAYGDVTGDGIEEAVIDYRTCNNGTGGGESEVYTLDKAGNLVNITPNSTKLSMSDYEKILEGTRGHGYFDIKDSKLILTYPLYVDGDSNASPSGGTRTITFDWDGNTFVYGKVSDEVQSE
ncbi:MAG: hypothetical protein V4473_01630 [Patescibacteria group bacterium]